MADIDKKKEGDTPVENKQDEKETKSTGRPARKPSPVRRSASPVFASWYKREDDAIRKATESVRPPSPVSRRRVVLAGVPRAIVLKNQPKGGADGTVKYRPDITVLLGKEELKLHKDQLREFSETFCDALKGKESPLYRYDKDKEVLHWAFAPDDDKENYVSVMKRILQDFCYYRPLRLSLEDCFPAYVCMKQLKPFNNRYTTSIRDYLVLVSASASKEEEQTVLVKGTKSYGAQLPRNMADFFRERILNKVSPGPGRAAAAAAAAAEHGSRDDDEVFIVLDLVKDAVKVNPLLMSDAARANYLVSSPSEKEQVVECLKVLNDFCEQHPDKKELTDIETKLFRLAVAPADDGKEDHADRFLSVFKNQDEFLRSQDRTAIVLSQSGIDNTRCMPFFFAMRAMLEDMNHPFLVVVEPDPVAVRERFADFRKTLGESVDFVDDPESLLRWYDKRFPTKPVVAVLHTIPTLQLVCGEKSENVLKRTRFCLDEVHRRTPEMDILIAELANRTKGINPPVPFQVVLMSDILDKHIQDCLGGDEVKVIELNEICAFEVDEKQIVVKDDTDIDEVAVDEMFDVIKKMANEEVDPGNMLVFTSGAERVQSMKEKLVAALDQYSAEIDGDIPVRLMDPESASLFQKKMVAEGNGTSTLMIVPVTVDENTTDEQKDFIKKTTLANGVKVVFATNDVGTSLAVKDLAAVIDCGVQNRSVYDEESGVTRVMESPSSIQSMNQHRGLLGYARDSIAISLTQEGKENPERDPPEIQTADLYSLILSTRDMGLEVESITNLPDPIDERRIKNFVEELKNVGSLDVEGKITKEGKKALIFKDIPSFISQAIIFVADKKPDPPLYKLLGAACAYVFNMESDIVDDFSDAFTRNYCEDSDVVTILLAALELGKAEKDKRKQLSMVAGLNSKWLLNFMSMLEELAHNLKSHEDNLFSVMYSAINDNRETFNDFVHELVMKIGDNKPQWLNIRRGTYNSIENIAFDGRVMFKAHDSLSFEDGNPVLVGVKHRPGSCSLSVPTGVFIMSISHDESKKINNGRIIIRDKNVRDCYPRPVCVPAPKLFTNTFADALLKGGLSSDPECDGLFQKMAAKQGKDLNEFFLRMTTNAGSFFTVVPLNDGATDKLNAMATQVETLVPFAASSVISYYKKYKCVVAVSNMGPYRMDYNTFFVDTEFTPYPLNAAVIKFLNDNIKYVNTPERKLIIACTGSYLSFPLEQKTVFFSEKQRVVANDKDYVFSDNQETRLVLLSSEEIPGVHALKWVEEAPVLSNEDYYAKVMFSGTNGLLMQKRYGNALFFFPPTPAKPQFVVPAPKLPAGLGGEELTLDYDGAFGPIGGHIQQYTIVHEGATGLAKPIEGASLLTKNPYADTYLVWASLKIENSNKKNAIITFLEDLVTKPAGEINKVLDEIEEFEVISERLEKATEKEKERRKQLSRKNPLISLHDVAILRKLQTAGQLIRLPDFVKNFAGIRASSMESLFIGQGADDRVPDLAIHTMGDDVNDTEADKLNDVLKIRLEKLPVFLLRFNHLADHDVTPEVFTQKINNMLARYSCFIFDISPYKKKSCQNIIGTISAKALSNSFMGHIRHEAQALFPRKELTPLKPDEDLVDPFLLKHSSFTKPFSEWLKKHALTIFKVNGGWFGSDDQVQIAQRLIREDFDRKEFPYHHFDVPFEVNLLNLSRHLKEKLRTKHEVWILNRSKRVLSVPMNVGPKDVDDLFATVKTEKAVDELKDVEYLADVEWCQSEAIASANNVDVFTSAKDGYSRKFCVTCMLKALRYSTADFYDETYDTWMIDSAFKKMKDVKPIDFSIGDGQPDGEGIVWPVMPLGQVMWALVHENSMANVARTWMTGQLVSALHHSLVLKSCPIHYREFVVEKGDEKTIPCKIKDCKLFFCVKCCRWHDDPLNCTDSIPPGSRRCPGCQTVVIKSGGCNRVTCTRCGKSFCYVCCAGPFNTPNECYKHLGEVHHGNWGDPPDYRRYWCGEDEAKKVTDEELEAYYQKYPFLRPLSVEKK